MGARSSDPTGLHRVLDEPAVLPQAAQRLDTRRELWPDEVRIRVEKLNLDAASFRQLERKHDGDGDQVRAEVLEIVAARGKMQNPETGSGGMLVGTVEEVGERVPARPRSSGDRVATLVSLTLTPLVIEDGLERLGRPQRAGALRRVRRPVRPLHRRGDPRRPAARPRPERHGRLRRPGADRARRRAVRRTDGRRHRRRRQVRLAQPRRRPGSRSRPHHRRRPAPGRGRPAQRRRARRRGRHRRRPRPDRAARRGRPTPADRPTSPSSASTSPAARAERSSPPPRAAPSSSSPWPPRSPPPRSAPRGWPPTSRCWSATATSPATRRTPWSCCAATPASASSSSPGSRAAG